MSETAFEKVSVTLPKSLVDSARARAGARGFSSYVAEGLRMAEHMADLDEFLAAHTAEHGPLPTDVMKEVRRAWPDPYTAASSTPARPRRRSSSTATG
ncbi:MAG: hypothetical protein M3P04_03425 [Actinomycetota bacterium]|nr:hypothetical protein [Actinomycetota bacterium]